MVEQDDVERLGDGPETADRFGRHKGVRPALVVERGAGELHLARKVDAPIAVEIIVARHVANGCVELGKKTNQKKDPSSNRFGWPSVGFDCVLPK